MKTLVWVTMLLAPTPLWAYNEYAVAIKDHRFEPTEIRIPAGQKVKLMIHNLDATPEEFDSHDLNREKVITPESKATIFIGPLKAGRYSFIGEFHQDTAQGAVIVE